MTKLITIFFPTCRIFPKCVLSSDWTRVARKVFLWVPWELELGGSHIHQSITRSCCLLIHAKLRISWCWMEKKINAKTLRHRDSGKKWCFAPLLSFSNMSCSKWDQRPLLTLKQLGTYFVQIRYSASASLKMQFLGSASTQLLFFILELLCFGIYSQQSELIQWKGQLMAIKGLKYEKACSAKVTLKEATQVYCVTCSM